jgi:hypothetical protein
VTKLYAKEVKQGGHVFYETSLPAVDVTDESMFTIDRFDPTTNQGYQREVNPTYAQMKAAVKSIAKNADIDSSFWSASMIGDRTARNMVLDGSNSYRSNELTVMSYLWDNLDRTTLKS